MNKDKVEAEKTISNGAITFFIIVTSIVMTLVSYSRYVKKYLNVNEKINNQIFGLIDKMYVSSGKEKEILLVFTVISGLIMILLGFVVYKVIFKITENRISDFEIFIAISVAYVLSFFVSAFLLGRINNVVVMLISNIVEMAIVFGLLSGKMKSKQFLCIVLRCIVMATNFLLI